MWWLEPLKGLVLIAVIFVPLERLLALRTEQKVFRRGWLNDVVYLLVNGQLITFALSAFVTGLIIAVGWLVPSGFRTFIAEQPYWLQIVEIIVLSDLGFYLAHR